MIKLRPARLSTRGCMSASDRLLKVVSVDSVRALAVARSTLYTCSETKVLPEFLNHVPGEKKVGGEPLVTTSAEKAQKHG